ncbi:MAG: GWxTD domain-containing protein [Balneolaceae bacterium]|nr:GWxTD domain-containing protein [Balneolaceae bacterium]
MRKQLLALFTLLLISTTFSQAQRQRVTYLDLINRSSTPQIFIDNIILPTADGNAELGIIFRFNNDFLPYKKITPSAKLNAPEGAGFYSIVRLNNEVFKGRAERNRRTTNVNVVSRDMWVDTLYTETFEQTESAKLYASGSLSVQLDPGMYHYVLQLSLIENTNDRNSNFRNVQVPDWQAKATGEIYTIKNKPNISAETPLPLTNLGDNILFGNDFYALMRIPNYDATADYSAQIYKMRTSRRDTSRGELIDELVISDSDLITGKHPKLKKGTEPSLVFEDSDLGYTYAFVKIPHSNYQNAAYTIELKKSGSDKAIAKKFFRSYWQDMPASLYNLDIAINHLKYILEDDQLKQIKSGSDAEKEQKFREFWEKRDPSKNTVYNELMAEYYRRIDYAFKEFGNRGNLAGHESDQGKVYINFGPPDAKDRQFPKDGEVIEIWKYGNKRFVFEASTGFGDFVLIGTE